ncbi:hypothetical protein MTBBW1_900018 [Desulfamplus magnetovallimortis]|uniref:Radical SAM core domain-containing protein n=1 Tax=Desulfamplus magnetovallimortis TaxID=1246637 RepID=A0A1W1HKX9_9BACT|nr:radical SAM protein [Desulfamplus magnetovallimortis]SLM33151.1 hypothetical protein MTBBW1_900018 [Desulfamplus magnetovallimortis]
MKYIPKNTFLYREVTNHITIPLGFKKDIPPVSPSVAGLFLTKKCNSRCKICEYWKNKNFHDELTSKDWFEVIDQLKESGIKIINFTADGEIFTRKDAFEIMHYAKQKGLQISVNTNGLVMDRYIDQLLNLNPMQIQISLDAFDDNLYESIRGVSHGFSRVKQGIMDLKHRGYNKISVGSVLTIDNLDELPLLQNFCIEQGFTYRVTAFQFQGFNVDNRQLRNLYRTKGFLHKLDKTIDVLCSKPMNNTEIYLKAIKNYYLEDKYHPLDCIVGHHKIFILPDGDVSLCNMMRKNAVIGNVLSGHSLIELWTSERAKEVRRDIRLKKCPSCWLSCFAEDNIRFSPRHMITQLPYFVKKAVRLLG